MGDSGEHKKQKTVSGWSGRDQVHLVHVLAANCNANLFRDFSPLKKVFVSINYSPAQFHLHYIYITLCSVASDIVHRNN